VNQLEPDVKFGHVKAAAAIGGDSSNDLSCPGSLVMVKSSRRRITSAHEAPTNLLLAMQDQSYAQTLRFTRVLLPIFCVFMVDGLSNVISDDDDSFKSSGMMNMGKAPLDVMPARNHTRTSFSEGTVALGVTQEGLPPVSPALDSCRDTQLSAMEWEQKATVEWRLQKHKLNQLESATCARRL
jgi:hypothetical protein